MGVPGWAVEMFTKLSGSFQKSGLRGRISHFCEGRIFAPLAFRAPLACLEPLALFAQLRCSAIFFLFFT